MINLYDLIITMVLMAIAIIVFGYSPVMIFSMVIAFFHSSTMHEISHAIVANLAGYKVHRINIGLFTNKIDIVGPIDYVSDFFISSAGPIANFLLFAYMFIAHMILVNLDILNLNNPLMISLILTNLILSVLNLIPIAQTDGYRMIRALSNLSYDVGVCKQCNDVTFSNVHTYVSIITNIIITGALIYFGIWPLVILMPFSFYESYEDYKKESNDAILS